MDETISRILGEYYRDLSLNYSAYSNNELPWPARPEGWYDPLQGASLSDLGDF